MRSEAQRLERGTDQAALSHTHTIALSLTQLISHTIALSQSLSLSASLSQSRALSHYPSLSRNLSLSQISLTRNRSPPLSLAIAFL